MARTTLPVEQVELDRLYRYPGTRRIWISLRTADGEYLTLERGIRALRTFETLRRAVRKDHGCDVENDLYSDQEWWRLVVWGASLRGLKD